MPKKSTQESNENNDNPTWRDSRDKENRKSPLKCFHHDSLHMARETPCKINYLCLSRRRMNNSGNKR